MSRDTKVTTQEKASTVPASRERDYYTVAQAARLLDVSPATVWRWIAAEKLPAYRVGPRTIRIRKQDLQGVITPVRGKEAPVKSERMPFTPPSAEELARRQALVATILAHREERSIAPMTTADLVREARKSEMHSYDPGN